MEIRNEEFVDETVYLSGNHYVSCSFQRCTLVFDASGPVDLAHNSFDQCNWAFEGAAALTVEFMAALYQGAGAGGRQLVEATFDQVRKGAAPTPAS